MTLNNWRVNLPWPEELDKDHDAVEYLYENEKGDTKSSFQEEEALAALLLSNAVFLNSNCLEKSWPEDARETVAICINANAVFAWGCAYAEPITYDEIEQVYRYWAKDKIWGTAVWAMIRTKQMPQKPVEDRIRKGGIWDLDALQKEHSLRANYYDGVNSVLTRRKRDIYEAWCKKINQDPLPYDDGWWEGWKQYIAAKPEWNDATWKKADDAAVKQWKKNNGYS